MLRLYFMQSRCRAKASLPLTSSHLLLLLKEMINLLSLQTLRCSTQTYNDTTVLLSYWATKTPQIYLKAYCTSGTQTFSKQLHSVLCPTYIIIIIIIILHENIKELCFYMNTPYINIIQNMACQYDNTTLKLIITHCALLVPFVPLQHCPSLLACSVMSNWVFVPVA